MLSSINSTSSLMTAIMAKLAQSQAASKSSALFSKADTDGSGKVSVDELAALAPQNSSAPSAADIVSSADTDGDSELTEDELLAYFSQLTSGGISGGNNAQLANAREGEGMMSVADSNDDGILSFDEFNSMKPDDVSEEQSQSLFNSADTDSDGTLSEEEVSAFEANRPQGGPQGAMMGPPPPPPSSEEDEEEDELSVSSIISQLIDSLQSTDESEETEETSTDTAMTDEEKIFSFFDADGDGSVSEEELNNGVAALKTAMSNYLLSLQESRAAA